MADLGTVERGRRLLQDLVGQAVEYSAGLPKRCDGLFYVAGETLVVEARQQASGPFLKRAIERVRDEAAICGATPLVIVASMGPAGTQLTAQAGVSWLDLSGNADIRAGSLRVVVAGRRAAHPKQHSELNPFSSRASRLIHTLLLRPRAVRDQTTLAREAGLDKGYVSKIVQRLADDGYVRKRASFRARLVEVSEPLALFTAWRERYRTPQPRSFALLSGRDGFETTERAVQALVAHGTRYALTGLAAAAEYTRFGSYRRVRLYVDGPISDAVATQLELEDSSRGRNLWIAHPTGAQMIGLADRHGQTFVSPIVACLDLAGEPERAEEATTEMQRLIERLWREHEQ